MEKIVQIARENREAPLTDRIVAQLNFARRLSEENSGKYDSIIEQAEEYIELTCGDDVPFTPEIVRKAEAILEPLRKEAKSYKVICASHAHIDMNWQWGWDETVGVAVDTVATMLKLLEEYPEFKFSLSQASTYKIIHDHAPELFARIKAYVHAGRWEVTAPSWVECDKNMPSGESLVSQVVSAKTYLANVLDIDIDSINLDFEPDTFGHSTNVPEILANAGVKYYYHCRGTNEPYTVYRWQAASGKEILVNRENNFYSSPVRSDMGLVAIEVAKKQGFKTTLRVYGVGDHGGGPSRRDIEKLLEMSSWPCFPNFVLGTYNEFFAEAEKHLDIIPVVKGEINFVCDGCYSAQSRIKSANKLCEGEIFKADAMSAEAKLFGLDVVTVSESTRQRFLTNHFHDIVTGSGVAATRDFALGEYQNVLADCRNVTKLSARKICDSINTADFFVGAARSDSSFGAGAGSAQAEVGMGMRRVSHVFNSLPYTRSGAAELMLWDWRGDVKRLVVTDSDGEVLSHQVMSKGFNHYWGHDYVSLLVYVTVPAGGYMTVIADEGTYIGTNAVYWPEKRQQWEETFILENEYLRVKFDSLDGTIISAMDKENGKEYIAEKAGVFRLITEACSKEISGWTSEMSAWLVGRYRNIEVLHKECELSCYHGEVRDGVVCEFSFGSSAIKFDAHLDRGSRLVKYDVSVRWLETGSHEKGVPQLSFYMPAEKDEYVFDVPFDTASRNGIGIDLPGNTFASSGDIAVLSKDVYGYRCKDSSISLTMLRGSFDPDPFPEYGDHGMSLAIAFGTSDMLMVSEDYMNGFTVMTNGNHGGTLPAMHKGIEVNGAYISSIGTVNGGIYVRIFNPGEKMSETEVNFPVEVKSAKLTDLFGNEKTAVPVAGGKISFAAKPGISTVMVSL